MLCLMRVCADCAAGYGRRPVRPESPVHVRPPAPGAALWLWQRPSNCRGQRNQHGAASYRYCIRFGHFFVFFLPLMSSCLLSFLPSFLSFPPSFLRPSFLLSLLPSCFCALLFFLSLVTDCFVLSIFSVVLLPGLPPFFGDGKSRQPYLLLDRNCLRLVWTTQHIIE